MEMGAFIRSKNVLLAELSEGAFIRRGALIRRNTVYIFPLFSIKIKQINNN
ncbi:hypothetical protein BBROOKSOX_672 [Bathymodiolus brooksi thiotrophic gill symbiont]|nr:hypothetical protein BBROOKSOX_672 [Bathymodiolus brooksi thiotrophic gill symbiont]